MQREMIGETIRKFRARESCLGKCWLNKLGLVYPILKR